MPTMMVSGDFQVVDLGPPPPLRADLTRRVDHLWDRHRAGQQDLHDGELFSVVAIGASGVTGRFVPYRRFVAQRDDPALVDAIGVAPLAVTGRTVTGDGLLVIARRGDHVTQDPGRWELAPAGGIDRAARRDDGTIDLRVALLRELQEELALGEPDVDRISTAGIVIDPESRVHDVVLDVHLRLDSAAVRTRFTQRVNAEYTDLRLVPILKGAGRAPTEGSCVPGFQDMLGLPFSPRMPG